ncbi:Cytochrome P450 [Geosmithia morbida]|uniref:Cytochrome P450 n=1 Tax=Geosmithia morbida TaxID=1094350 RepID=A0A9P4Z218_9HYPO|nr:Cytochrome P450 [Geosmithia morbida]KAF4125981.1 Cytochrome P450 [Geosmithia morbida]
MGVMKQVTRALASVAHDNPVIAIILVVVIVIVARSVYRGSRLHGLYAVPGPVIPRLTSTWLNYHAFIADECTAVHRLHEKYGPIVRTGPNSVDIADGAVLDTIYMEKGGFLKPEFYRNFDIDGHATIFTSTDPSYRALRAKAVNPLFSTANLRGGASLLAASSQGFTERLRRETARAKTADGKVNILALTRGFALDSLTSYLLRRRYGATDEDIVKQNGEAESKSGKAGDSSMSASSMVDSFVGVGKSWYLPIWAFQTYERFMGTILPDPQVDQSMACVDTFLKGVLDQAKQEVAQETTAQPATSFPARLLKAGFSDSEVTAQCKDLVFAGTDSTAMNLATICFMLCKHPAVYQALRREILAQGPSHPDPSSLPYLQAVIREGLRLSMANPTRLPRLVPAAGFRYGDYFLPQGTVVSCTPFELHLNGKVFQDPQEFKPERWLDDANPSEEMKRDMIPFGRGTRQCIARNLAMTELNTVVSKIAAQNALEGLKNVGDRIEIGEWFNSYVLGHKIELYVD